MKLSTNSQEIYNNNVLINKNINNELIKSNIN